MYSVAFVIPCYNEEEVLPLTARALEQKIESLKQDDKFSTVAYYRVYFVDDGSNDRTWDIIQNLNNQNKIFCGIKLAGNRGHQNALLAGLLTARLQADAVISMDADLQDNIDAVDEMLLKYLGYNEEGGGHIKRADIVFGVRCSRKTDSFFKKVTAQGFYRFLRFFSDNPKNIIYNHADYRLMSRRALEGLNEYSEVNLFLRGLIPEIGYKQDIVYYERHERAAGQSKYPLKKMLAFAVQGITSFSIKPMRIITSLGFLLFFVSIAMLCYFLVRHFSGHTVVGWSTLAVSIWGIGGLIQMSIGICGEYIGKIYLETKRRPRYIIDTVLEPKDREQESI